MMKEHRDPAATPASFVVVLHWMEELQARIGGGDEVGRTPQLWLTESPRFSDRV
jgi:hypothetical protein